MSETNVQTCEQQIITCHATRRPRPLSNKRHLSERVTALGFRAPAACLRGDHLSSTSRTGSPQLSAPRFDSERQHLRRPRRIGELAGVTFGCQLTKTKFGNMPRLFVLSFCPFVLSRGTNKYKCLRHEGTTPFRGRQKRVQKRPRRGERVRPPRQPRPSWALFDSSRTEMCR